MKLTRSQLVRHTLLTAILAFATAPLATPVTAAGSFFGSGAPHSTAELPSGEFRKSMEALPASAKARALQWLQSIEFSKQDLAYMKVDPQGSIYYVDTFESVTPGRRSGTTSVSPAYTERTVFKLHSRPGAANTIFLDFDGAEVSGKAWNSQLGAATWQAGPYDIDGKPKSFSKAEISGIAEIWERVAEDFAPFDVDVTTEDPGRQGQNLAWVVITDSEGSGKQPMPAPQAGSVTYMNTFGFSHTPYYAPAIVYHNNLGVPGAVAEATSHSIGHVMGLSHDTTRGSGSGKVSWAPIMGLDHGKQVTQWSKGDYPGAVNKQDDIGILIGALGLRRDDHADSRFDTGSPLVANPRGEILAIHPGIDPNHHVPENKGLIEDQDDIDVFVFDAGKGMMDITVTPAWQAYAQDPHRGANLDVHLSLYDAKGKKIAESDPRDETSSRLRKQLAPGRYKLEVRGTGNSASAYSRYGSIGQYYIAGSIPPGGKTTTIAKTGR